MNWWLEFLKISPGIAALVWQAFTWTKRLEDARRLEQMKSELRRDLEEDLKAHEIRLRVGADLKLRLHDKSWQLLRDLVGAAFEAHQRTTDLAMLLAVKHPNAAARREEQYEQAMSASVKLQMLAATAPPEYEASSLIRSFKEAASVALSMLADEDLKPRVEKMKQVRLLLNEGLGGIGTLCKAWNGSLWQATQELPQLQQGTQASPRPPRPSPREHDDAE